MHIGLYPGTFDPVTDGHVNIISRAVELVDRLVLGVAHHDAKGPLFSTDERVDMLRTEVAHLGARVEPTSAGPSRRFPNRTSVGHDRKADAGDPSSRIASSDTFP